MTARISSAACCLFAASAVFAATPPTITMMPSLSVNSLRADGATPYTVTLTVSDVDGYNDIRDCRVLFNYSESGGDAALGRGYMAWGTTDADITRYGGAWTLVDAVGGGRWGYLTDNWGGTTYMAPLGCSVTVSGKASGGNGTRTVTWTFAAKSAWAANPLMNGADAFVADYSFTLGWFNNPGWFDVVPASCAVTCATPQAPAVFNPTSRSLAVAISPTDSSVDRFAIRIVPDIDGNEFVQADGKIGPREYWNTRDGWGTKTITGLMWSTTYSFSARANRTGGAHCPSSWGPASAVTTANYVPRVNLANSRPFNPGVRGQNPYRSIAAGGYDTVWSLGQGSLGRGLAGGLDADTYDWRDINSGCNWGLMGGYFTTLEFLQYARAHAATPLLTANLFGGGAADPDGTFVCATQNPEGLAADWVRYTNVILQQYRQGQEGSMAGEDLRVYNSIANWGGRPKLLAPGEAPTPPVKYWEIGNEPELGGIGGMLSNHYLGPVDYRDRFKLMSAAMRVVDPTLKIGPCLMTPALANGSGQLLDTLAADPEARIDFVAYHPYYSSIRNSWGNLPDMAAGLRKLKAFLAARSADIRSIMNNRGRTNYELLATEWNPVNWDASSAVQRSQANALAAAEAVFSFAEDGLAGANFWEQPQGKLGVAGAFTGLALHMGDTLVAATQDLGVDPARVNWRVYVTRSAADPSTIMVWGLNFNEDTPVELQFSLPPCRVDAATLKRYGKPRDDAAGGDTSLMHGSGMTWEQLDVSAGFDSRLFTFRMEDAEITVLILRIVSVAPVDHDCDGDVDMDDFGWFQTCMSGFGEAQNNPDCADARFGDNDVDADDLATFRKCLSGSNVPAVATCAPAP